MNAKVVAVGLVIVILVVALFLSGIIPGFRLPQKAQLIAVSSVNIEPGGSVQNSYVVGTDWDIALTVNSFQNVAALELGPSNQTTCGAGTVCSGQKVIPTSQVYITLTPGQPYVSVNLIPGNLEPDSLTRVVPLSLRLRQSTDVETILFMSLVHLSKELRFARVHSTGNSTYQLRNFGLRIIRSR